MSVDREALIDAGAEALMRLHNGEMVFVEALRHEVGVVVDVVIAALDRDTLLAMVYELDVASGRRVPFETDHVHPVSNRDEGVARA